MRRRAYAYGRPVTNRALNLGNMTMAHTCHHKGRGGSGACGGCFARANEALDAIRAGEDPKAVIEAYWTAVRAEQPKLKRPAPTPGPGGETP